MDVAFVVVVVNVVVDLTVVLESIFVVGHCQVIVLGDINASGAVALGILFQSCAFPNPPSEHITHRSGTHLSLMAHGMPSAPKPTPSVP